MYKVLIKKGFATDTTEDDNYSEFYLDLYRNIRDNLKVWTSVNPKIIINFNTNFLFN